MNDFFGTVQRIKELQDKYKDCYDLYYRLKDSGLKTLITTGDEMDLYGMFFPDKNIEHICGKYKGRLTKKEEKKDFKYYFDEQDRVILTERYSNRKLNSLIFYFYNQDNIEIIRYRLKEMRIIAVGEINYINGKISKLFLTDVLELFNKYGIKHLIYTELLFDYTDTKILINRRQRAVDDFDRVYNSNNLYTKLFYENMQKDVIPETNNVIITSSSIIQKSKED